jgi:hypothetical protein
MAAEQKHDASKQETAGWGGLNGPTPAEVHMARGHLDQEIEVEGAPNDEE